MKDIPNKSIDMILCDLPYGATRNKSDKRLPFAPLWKQYKRIIKDNGCIVLFAQGKFYIDLVKSNYKMFRYYLVWDKVLTTGFLNAKRMPLVGEFVNCNKDCKSCEDRWLSNSYAIPTYVCLRGKYMTRPPQSWGYCNSL